MHIVMFLIKERWPQSDPAHTQILQGAGFRLNTTSVSLLDACRRPRHWLHTSKPNKLLVGLIWTQLIP